jgi:hypothetical protein
MPLNVDPATEHDAWIAFLDGHEDHVRPGVNKALDRYIVRITSGKWTPAAAQYALAVDLHDRLLKHIVRVTKAGYDRIDARHKELIAAQGAKSLNDLFEVKDALPRQKFDFIAAQMAAIRQRALAGSTTIAAGMHRRASEIVADGVKDGKSQAQIASTLFKQGLTANRAAAKRIARTETHVAASRAQFEAAKHKRLKVTEKGWIAHHDDRTRPTHLVADGQVVDYEENFEVGGYPMMYPGDDSGGAPANEIIGCRCSCHYTLALPTREPSAIPERKPQRQRPHFEPVPDDSLDDIDPQDLNAPATAGAH